MNKLELLLELCLHDLETDQIKLEILLKDDSLNVRESYGEITTLINKINQTKLILNYIGENVEIKNKSDDSN